MLVDHSADESPRNVPSILTLQEILITHREERTLSDGCTRSDDGGEVVGNEEEDERDGLYGLREESAKGREGLLFGGVGYGERGGSTTVGEESKQLLFPTHSRQFVFTRREDRTYCSTNAWREMRSR